MALPEQLVNEFRVVALERLARIEHAWDHVIKELDPAAADLIHHELHTLKGECRMVGFGDVNLVCHKCEDLFELAQMRGFAVDDDLDLAVNMALRFMTMLVRKRVGTNLGGFDLPGFIRHIDKLLEDARREHTGRTRSISSQPIARPGGGMRIARAVRDKFTPAAIDAFIEFAVARGQRRNRLRASWHLMRDLVGIHRALLGPDQLDKHREAGLGLARDLGKAVDVKIERGSIEITTEILAAIDSAIVHLVRNAIDHGIETREARTAAGKPPVGTVTIARKVDGDRLILTVSDDGAGIDFARVRARAIELGFVNEDVELDRDQWIDIVCSPGFTTRKEASDVSGRGVGLDAVRGFAREVGGTLEGASIDGVGTTWSLSFPLPTLTVEGYLVRAPNVPFPILLDASWKPSASRERGTVIDLAAWFGLADMTSGSASTFENGSRLISVMSTEPCTHTRARAIVATGSAHLADVIMIDVSEGLLVRPEHLLENL